jgi:hypothetical protein
MPGFRRRQVPWNAYGRSGDNFDGRRNPPDGPQKGRALLLQVQHNHVYQNSRCPTKTTSTFHGFGNRKMGQTGARDDWIA